MSTYLDSSVLVSLFVKDTLTPRAQACAERLAEIEYSTWCQAEFASALGNRVRTGELDEDEVVEAQRTFDAWCVSLGPPLPVLNDDVLEAERLLRRLELKLRAPDALHIALVRRLELRVATLDDRMAKAAALLGLLVEPA